MESENGKSHTKFYRDDPCSSARSKTDELELAKEKGGFFCTEYFVRREIFSFCALARVLNTLQNIHIFTCHKTLLHALLLLAFKIIERLQCILN